MPGFVDLHVHGAEGLDAISDDDASPQIMFQRWKQIGRALAHDGVAAFLITLHATSVENVRTALQAATLAEDCSEYDGAYLIGLNLEGPYLNPDAAGAHRRCHLHTPTQVPLSELIGRTPATLPRMITIAPELPGALGLIRECTHLGIICSIGHTLADAETIAAAVRAGARSATHYGNAMGVFHQRAPGAIGTLPIMENVMLEVVPNEAMLHPTVWSLVRAAAGPRRVILVSDSLPSTGSGAGVCCYEFSGTEVRDDGDGVVVRAKDGRVWGNTRPMPRLAAAYAERTGCSLEELRDCTSANAARLLGLEQFGGLRPGQRGSAVVIDSSRRLRASIVDGTVYNVTAD